MKPKCPTCNKVVVLNKDNPTRPFCSERCKLVDLSKWLDGSYAIPGDDVPRHEQDHNVN